MRIPKSSAAISADNWRTVSYVVSTPQMLADDAQQNFPIVTPALEHSRTVARFNTGGWPVEVRRVEPDVNATLPTVRSPAEPSCMRYG